MSQPEASSQRHWYLLSYDIRDDRRWRKSYKLLRGTGEHLQYSLFRCHLTRTEMAALRWKLEQILAKEDDLLVIDLCPGCAGRVEVRGAPSDWQEARPRYEIF